MNTKARPETQLTPLVEHIQLIITERQKARPETQLTPPVKHIQLIITKNVKRHIYINYQPPPLKIFQPGSSETPWIIGQGKPPKIMMIATTRKSGPVGDVRGEGESSMTEPQDPTDGSYIMSAESCNI